MKYLSVTQIDAVTGIICTAEPMRTGPSYPPIKNCVIHWTNESTWPIPTTPEGAHTRAPLFFGTCDDDADLTVSGVVATYTAEEFQALKTAEHQARKPYPSWIGDESKMTWEPPVPLPVDGRYYYWDEPTTSWIAATTVERV
jgi:hypothetical protein